MKILVNTCRARSLYLPSHNCLRFSFPSVFIYLFIYLLTSVDEIYSGNISKLPLKLRGLVKGAELMTSPSLANDDAPRDASNHQLKNYLYDLLDLFTIWSKEKKKKK